MEYCLAEVKRGTRVNQVMRHTVGLFHGISGANYWKRYLSNNMLVRDADVNKLDYTNTFRDLINENIKNENLKDFYSKWKIRVDKQNRDKQEVLKLMRKNNPVVIPRNHKVEESLKEAHKGNLLPLNNLLNALKDPYTERGDLMLYQQPAPDNEKKYKTFCGT